MKPVHKNRPGWSDCRSHVQKEGATKQHGPRLPLGTDRLLAIAVCDGVATRVGGLVAPPVAPGGRSQPRYGGGQHFCRTTSLDAAALIGLVRSKVREFARHGVRHRVLYNGHSKTQWFVTEGIDLAVRDLGPDTPITVTRPDYWDFFTSPTLERIVPESSPGYAL